MAGLGGASHMAMLPWPAAAQQAAAQQAALVACAEAGGHATAPASAADTHNSISMALVEARQRVQHLQRQNYDCRWGYQSRLQ